MKLAERAGGDASICGRGQIWPIRQLKKHTEQPRIARVPPPAGAVAAHYIISATVQGGWGGRGWIDGTLNIKRGRLYWGLSDGERGVNIVPD